MPERMQRRGTRYYLRTKVPAALRPIIGKREIVRALGTGEFREAAKRVRLASAEVEADFAEARRRLDPEPRRKLSEHDARELALLWFSRREQDVARREVERSPGGPDEHEAALAHIREDEAALSLPLSRDVPDVAVVAAVDKLLAEQNIEADRTGEAYWQLAAMIRRAKLEGVRRSRRRLSGDYAERASDPVFQGVGATTEPEPAQRALTLAELVERYMNDPARAHLTPKTKVDYEASFRVLKELIGADKPIDRITREDCRRAREILVSLPPNSTKRFPKLTLEQAAALAREKGLPTLSPKAVNDYLASLASLFKWAIREDYAERNPAQGLRVSAPENKRDARRPFSPAQLQAIVNALASLRADPNASRPSRYWVPLIALYSGMRLGEILQLGTDDVTEVDGVPVIWVRPDEENGKRLKTASARRIIPVHSELIKIGLLDHAARQRAAGETRLFPDAKAAPGRHISDPAQKAFSHFLKNAGAAAPRTSFHSLRHNFRDALGEAGVPGSRIDELMGWVRQTMRDAVYGSGTRASTLAREVNKVAYPGLDLSRLDPDERG